MWFGLLFFFSTIHGNPPPPSCLSLFPKAAITSLHVYSPDLDTSSPLPFIGKPLPPSAYAKAYRGHPEEFQGYYAVSKFRISRGYNGFIVREPSQYESSEIKLYVIGRFSKRVVASLILADHFGDGLWFFERNSWLFMENEVLKVISVELNVNLDPDDPEIGDYLTATEHRFINGHFEAVPCDPRVLASKYHLKFNMEIIGDETKYVVAP
jgi:hypothetical protein